MFGFFKKKKTPPQEPPAFEKTVAATPKANDRTAPDKEFFAKDPYAVSIKRAGLRFLHERGDNFEPEHVFNLINGLIDVEVVRLQLEVSAWRHAQEIIEKEDKAQADRAKNLAIAETAMRIDRFLHVYKDEVIRKAVDDAEVETLIKAFIAIDFGAFPLKPEASVNLRYTQGLILEELRRRGVVVKGPFEQLQEQLHHAIKSNAAEETVTDMTKKLFAMLVDAACLYVATDEDFNPRFAHITYDGRAEVFTKRELADRFAVHSKEAQLGLVGVREIAHDDIPAFFEELYDAGVNVFRLDNGFLPVDVWLSKVLPEKERFFIDDGHRETRGYLLRELQYGYRLQKTPVEDAQRDRSLKEQMLNMRFNGYRLLGRGLLYVLLPDNGKPAVTYYSKEALKKAKAVIEEKGLSAKALLASGDEAYAQYEGPLQLRVVQLPGEGMDKALVCAFTDHRAAQDTLARFRQNGVNDRIVVVTWDEIYRTAQQCAGVMIDLPAYGRQLKKEEFGEILKFREISMPIVTKMTPPKDSE